MKLIEELRTATRGLHSETEKKLLPSISDMEIQDYIFFLQCNYAFHYVYEPLICQTAFSNNIYWSSFNRYRLAAISSDLLYLNALPDFDIIEWDGAYTEPALLGAAYVSEGSTLGGSVIVKSLKNKPFFERENFGLFITGLGAETGPAWKSFLNLLQQVPRADHEAVVQGAVDAFELFLKISKSLKGRQSLEQNLAGDASSTLED